MEPLPNTPIIDPEVRVVRVFCDSKGDYGNPLGVVLAGGQVVGKAARQRVASALGFSETVFIDDRDRGALQIFTPEQELPLAGHPLVGTAWLLAALGTPVSELRPPAGVVRCGADASGAWFEADPSLGPAWNIEQVASPELVDAIDAASAGDRGLVWAWADEVHGIVRARFFIAEHGVPEDEATGSAALRLCGQLKRTLIINQGKGSVIHATPGTNGHVRVAGAVCAAPSQSLPPQPPGVQTP